MQLDHAFYRLPLRFDVTQLQREIAQFTALDWRRHPQGHANNSALPLVAANGDPSDQRTRGVMQPTPFLDACPYLRQVMRALQAPIGRSRLMRIAGRSEAQAHVDIDYYWSQRVRVHVPILTYPGVRFLCGDDEAFMDQGEAWIFDTWRSHNVLNPDERPRIHLVVDTAGSADFWGMVAKADKGASLTAPNRADFVANDEGATTELLFEPRSAPVVMTPAEVTKLIAMICERIDDEPSRAVVRDTCASFLHRWTEHYRTHGDGATGHDGYGQLLGELAERARDLRMIVLRNGMSAQTPVEQWIIAAALNPEATSTIVSSAPKRSAIVIERPVFIVAAPRSGSSMLFESLARSPEAFTVGGESHVLIESIPELSVAQHGYASNRLTAIDANADVSARLRDNFIRAARSARGSAPVAGTIRLLEKTPKNALRIPFLAATFPDARFIYLYREPEENVASIIEAWASDRFQTYRDLPNAPGPWSLVLIPGWRELIGTALADIAVAQWRATNQQILDDLAALPQERFCMTTYAAITENPVEELARLAAFADLEWSSTLASGIPLSKHTLTPPRPDKWRKHAAVIVPRMTALEELRKRAYVVRQSDPHKVTTTYPRPAAASRQADPGAQDFRSVHTSSFTQLLRELRGAVMVSTYQAGKLIILRDDGEKTNTHFRTFKKPMGLALRNDRLAIGTEIDVREYQNVPAVAAKLPPIGRHDGCFMPRASFVTGNIAVHDLGWGSDELWFVNTSFSCLCTPGRDSSFVPRWRPSFIDALCPEDRCHLNGLAMVDGRPGYVTALARTNEARGWRAHKRAGGIVMDVATGEIIASGLSMPHSPRWHDGKLWVLDSGTGGVGIVEPRDGRYIEVARLPGFTRGLEFIGRYAFVGLSQVRESITFGELPITQVPVDERACGVWVIDTKTGAVVAWVKFDGVVQEVFAVIGIIGVRFPELVNDDFDLIASSFVLPQSAMSSAITDKLFKHPASVN
ncbi:MAG: TIGR03032 family protein [Clostridia bacterium]|nr:TIGR03032 family protein [Deltaproteobacteria bacterium]